MSHQTIGLTDDAVARLPISEGRAELLEEILMTEPAADRATVPLLARGGRVRRVAAGVAAVAAVAAVSVGVPMALGGHGHSGHRSAPIATRPDTPDYSRSALAVWPMAKGWRVLSTEESGHGGGEITYGTGAPWTEKLNDRSSGGAPSVQVVHHESRSSISITWYPARLYKGYAADRAAERSYGDLSVLGHTGHAITYGPTDHAVMRPPVGRFFLEVRVGGVGAAAFERIVGELKGTDAKGLQASLPDTFVKDGDRQSTIAEMAKGIPLPPGFSLADIHSRQTDPYQLGAEVTGAITCAWIEDWSSGDKDAAVAAMATSRHWPVLNQMNPRGDYPEEVWQVADEMRHGTAADRPEWAMGLGCR